MSITLNKPEWIPSIDLLVRGLLSLFTHNGKADAEILGVWREKRVTIRDPTSRTCTFTENK